MSESSQKLPVCYGDVLAGKYRVERVLGAGGMGLVVAARHIELDELFAIKFMLPAAVVDPVAVERFLREARASARLKSEHVARVHDVGRLETGAPYMVMEHLSGSDLKSVVVERGALPLAEVVTYVIQACEAIAEAHSLGIVHRDLKPANLFLTTRLNGSPCVKVLDFGISKQTVPGEPGMDITKTAALLGSPLYMAPEQMRSTKTADLRADVWALGVILYELCTGTVPFHGETITEVCAKVLSEEAPAPSTRQRDLPPDLDAVVARCLAKDPARRFRSVIELSASLLRLTAAAKQDENGPLSRGARPAEALCAVRAPEAQAAPQPPRLLAAPPEMSGTRTASSWAGRTGPAESRRASRRIVGLAMAAVTAAAIGIGALILTGRAPASPAAGGGDSGRPAGLVAEHALESTSTPDPPPLSPPPAMDIAPSAARLPGPRPLLVPPRYYPRPTMAKPAGAIATTNQGPGRPASPPPTPSKLGAEGIL